MRYTKIWVRLLLLSAVMLGPILLITGTLASEQSEVIRFASAERRGVEYQGPAWDVMVALTAHRTAGAAVVSGDEQLRDTMLAREREVDQALTRLEAVDRQLGAEMHTTELLSALEANWAAVKKASTPGQDFQSYLTLHNRLVYDMGRLIIKMGNHSNLILDPDIDTYYLMDATQFKLSRLLDQLTEIQALGAAALARGGGPTPLERGQLATASTRVDEYLNEGVTNLNYAFDANPELRTSLGGSVSVLQSTVDDTLSDANHRFAGIPEGTLQDWLASTDKAIAADTSLYRTTLANLDKGLAARSSAQSWRRAITMVGVLFMVAVSGLLTLLVVRSIIGPLGHLRSTAGRISVGELDAKIDTSGRDEVSELSKAFVRMQESLKIAAREAGEI